MSRMQKLVKTYCDTVTNHDDSNVKCFEQLELAAKLLEYCLCTDESKIIQKLKHEHNE